MSGLVSIIMPSYNTAKYIRASIKSVQEQTYTNWELIIVDDGSTDETEQIINNISDQRIRFYQNETNRGAAVSRNRALREARGKWIAFLDSDDLWYPDKLEKQIMFMQNNNYLFSYTNYIEIDENSIPKGTIVTGPKCITKKGMYNYCWVGCLTVMYDAEKIGLIQITDIKKNNDYAMWLKVCHKTNCYLLEETLARYRKRSGSISNHGYIKLIQWHYKLYREAEGKSKFSSTILTIRNLFFGVIKKIKYIKRGTYASKS